MKVNKAVTKVTTIGKDAEAVGGLDAKQENANVKQDNKKKAAAFVDGLFGHMTNGIEDIWHGHRNTRRGKQWKHVPRGKRHTNTAKFSKRAKLKRKQR